MSTTAGPADVKLPQRSGTVSSSFTRRTSMSDDEVIPATDSSEVCIHEILEEKECLELTVFLLTDYQSPA